MDDDGNDDNDDNDSTLGEGTVIGEYTLINKLAEGGNAEVWRACSAQGEVAAVKVLFPFVTLTESKRFLRRERRIARKLKHRNIVETYDAGLWRKRGWIAMELLKGQTLAQYMSRGVSLRDAVAILLQCLDGLDEIHKICVHRDVSVNNIWRCQDGAIKVIDFGIALSHDDTVMTEPTTMMGTPGYASPPEIWRSVRGDYFSLGRVAIAMLTGAPQHADWKHAVAEAIDDELRGHDNAAMLSASLIHLLSGLQGERPGGPRSSSAEIRAALQDIQGLLLEAPKKRVVPRWALNAFNVCVLSWSLVVLFNQDYRRDVLRSMKQSWGVMSSGTSAVADANSTKPK